MTRINGVMIHNICQSLLVALSFKILSMKTTFLQVLVITLLNMFICYII